MKLRKPRGDKVLSKKSNKALFNLFSILLGFFTLTNVSNQLLHYLGLGSILMILIISSVELIVLYGRKNQVEKSGIHFLILYVLLILILSIGLLSNINSRGLTVLAEVILLLNFYLLFSRLSYDKNRIDPTVITVVLTIYLMIFYAGLFQSDWTSHLYRSIYLNPNTLGIISLLFSWLAWILYKIFNKKIYLIYSLLFIFILYRSSTRSSLFIVFFVLFNLVIYKFIATSRLRWNTYFAVIIVAILFVTYLYPSLGNYAFFSDLNGYAINLTGKNILSGRNLIWQEAIYLISEKPVFGYGTGTLLANISDINVSAHNLYLQISIQNGILGLSMFLILLLTIWDTLFQKVDDSLVKLSACFFIGILVQNLFEVTLTQNNIGFAIIQWFIISIGVSRVRSKKNQLIKHL